MNILIGTVVLGLLAGWVWLKLGTDARRTEAYASVRRMLIFNTPRIFMALFGAGLFAELLPEDVVRQYANGDACIVAMGTALSPFHVLPHG